VLEPIINSASARRLVTRHLWAITLAFAVLLAVAMRAPSAAKASGTCSLTSLSSTSQGACWRPFADTSFFNTPLPASPKLAGNSSAVVSGMASKGWSIGSTDSGFAFSPVGTHPLFFAGPSAPTKRIQCQGGRGSCTGANGVNVSGATIHVPAGAQAYSDSDGHLTVIQTSTGREYDFWRARISGSTIEAGAASEVNVNDGDGRGSQGDAAFFALSAGVIRPSELASGEIDHALVLSVPCVSGEGSNGYVWPAPRGDGSPCGSGGGAPALGQLLTLDMSDAQIASSSAPGWEKTIMTAWAHYGAYVEDTGGGDRSIGILTQSASSWTDLGQSNAWAHVAGGPTFSSPVPIPVNGLRAVDPCVPQGRCGSAPGSAAPVGSPPQSGPASGSKHHKKHKKHHHKHRHHKKHHRKHHHKHRHHKHRHHRRHHRPQ
jgi:hypothetical protein